MSWFDWYTDCYVVFLIFDKLQPGPSTNFKWQYGLINMDKQMHS